MELIDLTHLSLFTGIGGIDIAAEWAGFTTVGQCEWAEYPSKVLEKHWPDVPRWQDVRDLTKETFYEKTGRKTVELLSGGFPCQPFSVAGKQLGQSDDQHLWPEMLRVIREINPTWVLGENVPGILKIAGQEVCEDLERAGYAVTVFNFEAAAIGAPHRRARAFFVAHANGKRLNAVENEAGDSSKIQRERQFGATGSPYHHGWGTEPGVGRVANGVPHRVDRLKCLGNAVVPQQVYPILKGISKILLEDKTLRTYQQTLNSLRKY